MTEGLQLVWYDAERDIIFQSGLLESLFCALAIRTEWWGENPQIDVIGLI